MIKKIALSSFASVILLSQVANAEIKVAGGSLSFTAGIMSQYLWRGLDQNDDRSSPYASVDFTRPIGPVDFYAGIWSAAAGGNGAAYTREENYYGGIKKTFGPASFDVGLVSIKYNSGNTASNPINSVEGYIKVNVAPEKSPFTIGAQYVQNDSGGNTSGTVKDAQETYQEINATYDAKFAVLGISYGEFKEETDVTTFTVTKPIFDVNFVAAYISADRANTSSSTLGNKNREYLTLTASKTF
jgi:uncharacterized protein (TIGR02001 family)